MITLRGTSRTRSLTRSGRLSRALIVSTLIAASAGWVAERGHAQAVQPLPFLTSAAIQANCLDGGLARVGLDARSGAVHFVGSNLGRVVPQPSGLAPGAAPVEAARHYLSVCGSLFGVRDPSAGLEVRRQRDGGRGRSVVRFQQMERGIPVIAGELLVNLNARQDVLSVSGEVAPRFDGSITPAVAREEAADTAREIVTKQYQLPSDAVSVTAMSLEIYAPGLMGLDAGPPRLVWRIEVGSRSLDDIRELVLIDAQRGSVALHFNQVETLRDRRTYTANNGSALPGTLVCAEADDLCSAGDATAQGAHRYARDTYDFYLAHHSRDGIDGAGGTLVSTVHYRPAGAPNTPWANAGWTGTQMLYGDAYGFAMADDVVAHELTHGVTQHESGLFYFYQSGAINESFSDIWGEFVDQSNGAGNDTASVKWLMGEDIVGLGAIRSMSNPLAYGQPDKMTSASYSGTADDNGGVHRNSGINNKAAFLMTDGGSFNGQTITGLGLAKVATIYYEVNANLLTSGADYSDLYNALYQGCLNLVGTAGITLADCAEVRKATVAVEMNLQPLTGTNIEAPTCPVGQAPRNIFFDDLERGSGNFTFGSEVGSARWQLDAPGDPYAHSGLHELYANDTPPAVTDTTASMTNSYTLPANAYLRFDHAFFFEQEFSSWDGGVVEYSIDGGASWVDAGALFDAVGYNGTLNLSTNPLSGRAAFVRSSHGYIASRLSLASLAGQRVRFRWRVGLDSSVDAGGWWLDDIRIYTCGTPPPTDVDGDGKTDITVYRPSTAEWWVLRSGGNFATHSTQGWGLPGDVLEPGDYDGDGKLDLAVYRPTTAQWWILWSSTNFSTYSVFGWGLTGDIPVPADYDGDAVTDIAIYRPTTGGWWVLKSSTGFNTYSTYAWGLPGDIPVVGDFDGDGKSDPAIYRPSTADWWILKSSTSYGTYNRYGWGVGGDIPVAADYDGDGKTDIAVYRPTTGGWWILTSSTGFATYSTYGWGLGGDVPVLGDYDGDGKTDIAIYRPTTGGWWILLSSTGFTQYSVYQWGQPGDVPVLQRR